MRTRARGRIRGALEPLRPARVAALLAVLASLATGIPARAQTLRPVVVEYYGATAKGKFELANDGLVPLTVILEPKSFDVTETGDAIYRALDPRIRLRLSTMSVRIPARQSRWVFFEARTDSVPAWFVVTATFSGMPKRSGLEVLVELPHTVYLVQKELLRREDVRVTSAVYSAAEKWILLEIENRSPRLGRVTQVEAFGKGERREHPSFPLLPGGRRQLLIPWDAASEPDRVTLRFQGFTLEVPLQKTSQVAG
ncbi:MAG TPA: hypothetical protein VE326_08595 [Candidatus Binatia bacterium]|nr:hypothetical protein [Candidatus Binatia bacterium]